MINNSTKCNTVNMLICRKLRDRVGWGYFIITIIIIFGLLKGEPLKMPNEANTDTRIISFKYSILPKF